MNMRPNWLKKLFYKWSGHDDRIESWARELALRDMLHTGIELGKKQAQSTVIEKRVCRLHPIVLLNEVGPGHYICMLCQEERNTGPVRAVGSMSSIYHAERRSGAGTHTAIQKAVRLTQDLSKNQGETR